MSSGKILLRFLFPNRNGPPASPPSLLPLPSDAFSLHSTSPAPCRSHPHQRRGLRPFRLSTHQSELRIIEFGYKPPGISERPCAPGLHRPGKRSNGRKRPDWILLQNKAVRLHILHSVVIPFFQLAKSSASVKLTRVLCFFVGSAIQPSALL